MILACVNSWNWIWTWVSLSYEHMCNSKNTLLKIQCLLKIFTDVMIQNHGTSVFVTIKETYYEDGV